MNKRLLSILLAFIIVMSFLTTATAATDYTKYYLVGWINGADCGQESDWESLHSEYQFDEDGKLEVTFTELSYVFIKTSDNVYWYLTQNYVEPNSSVSATLAQASDENQEKVGVYGNVPVCFTLTENTDGTLTLSYTSETLSNSELLAKALVGEEQESVDGVFEVTDDKTLNYRTVKLLTDTDFGSEDIMIGENVFFDLNHFKLTTTGTVTNNGTITLHQENADIVDYLLYNAPGYYATDEEVKLPNDESPDYVIPAGTFLTSEVGTSPEAYQELKFASGDDALVWNKDVPAGMQLKVTYALTLGGDILGAKSTGIKPTKVTANDFALGDDIEIGGNDGEGEAALYVESIPADDLYEETVGTFKANGKKIILNKSGKFVISSNIRFNESVLVSGVEGYEVSKSKDRKNGTITYTICKAEKTDHSVIIEIGNNTEEEKEENPNTGASVMGIASAAVLVGAAFIIAKKHSK